MKISCAVIASLTLLIFVASTGFLTPLHCGVSQTPRIVDLIRNGGFEEPEEWDAYYVGGPGYSRVVFDTTMAHDGAYSARIQSRGGPSLEFAGGGIRQAITRDYLNFDLKYVFWIYPNVKGRAEAPPYTLIRTWVQLELKMTSKEKKVARLIYHVAWGNVKPSDSADTVNFFIDCKRGEWNYIERNIGKDFEGKFGSASQFSLMEIEVGFELLRQGGATVEGMQDPLIFVDDVSLQMILPVVKASSSISCSASLSNVREGESINISGFLSPARGGIPIKLTYKKPDGSTFTKSITTSPEGRFADAQVPNVVGEWTVFASWSGDEGTLAATSPSISFTVEAKPKPPPPPPLIEQTTVGLLSIVIATIIAPAFILLMKRRKSSATEAKRKPEKPRASRFSKQLGLDHSHLRGKKILFEFDPSAPYERLVRDFGLECASENEAVVVLTRRGSAIQRIFEREEGVELVDVTPQTMLTPILNEHPRGPFSVVYDSLTDLALSVGPQVAYKFARDSIQLLSDSRITALFLLNPSAHETKEVSSLRGLFGNQVVCGKRGITSSRFC